MFIFVQYHVKIITDGVKNIVTNLIVNCYNSRGGGRNEDCPFPPKSREEIYKDLEISRQQAAEGKYQEMGEALTEIREKYGL